MKIDFIVHKNCQSNIVKQYIVSFKCQ